MTSPSLTEVTRYLDLAEAVLFGQTSIPRVPPARAACWLARRALETLVPLILAERGIAVGRSRAYVQLICLQAALADDDRAVAHDLCSAWDQLSRACHHHAYELTPTHTEAQLLTQRVRAAARLVVDSRGGR